MKNYFQNNMQNQGQLTLMINLWQKIKQITKARNRESTKLKFNLFRVFACPVGPVDRTGVLSCFRDKYFFFSGLSQLAILQYSVT